MACFFHSNVDEFLAFSEGELLARLEIEYARQGFVRQFTDQTLTWFRDIASLRTAITECTRLSRSASDWGILLEFSIPRKTQRIDVVLLVKDTIIVLEAKTGDAGSEAKKQVQEYALLLHYFHKATFQHRIIPVVISADGGEPALDPLRQQELFPQLPTYWVSRVTQSSWQHLSELLISIENPGSGQLDSAHWNNSPFFPIPNILEAAVALKSGLSIREIAHSEASVQEIEEVREAVQQCLGRARADGHHAICFLTGVPGSGKTLVGLSLAHSEENKNDAIHFMSGNGPLVKVLQHLFTQESMEKGAHRPQANAEAKLLIENVHVFAKYYTEGNLGAPSNHAIIFDEAQRAWNRAQNMRKFARDYSEPEMLLRIMGRHEDWAIVVALVGGGQEINDGEAGLEEWGRALAGSSKDWRIYASPEVIAGGASTAGHRLFDDSTTSRQVETTSLLHLRTARRSLRAERLATWVNLVLEGDADGAAALRVAERFPIFLSRNLAETRVKLREQSIGVERCGLVGSSGASRLRAEGLEPSSSFHAEYPWEHWYLGDATDVRSSYRCEVFATEFEIQGLELDWIGLCWGGDLTWDDPHGWQLRALRHGRQSKWSSIKSNEKRIYKRNAYRVLLTRARKGMVIFVPMGEENDPTNEPRQFQVTAEYLVRCGVMPLPSCGLSQVSFSEPRMLLGQ
jgi:hypothetical protein